VKSRTLSAGMIPVYFLLAILTAAVVGLFVCMGSPDLRENVPQLIDLIQVLAGAAGITGGATSAAMAYRTAKLGPIGSSQANLHLAHEKMKAGEE